MKIQYFSDLHLEFEKNRAFVMGRHKNAHAETLILAGDIAYLGENFYKLPYFDFLADHYKEVYWVPGNHEFYGGYDLANFEKPFLERIRPNVYLLNNKSIIKGKVELFFTTLWSKLDDVHAKKVVLGVNDFYQIKSRGKTIGREEFEHHHNLSLAFLDESIKQSTADKKVVVSHHVPTQLCNAEEFRGSVINSAFVVELEDQIVQWEVDYWLYGHHHRNVGDKSIGKTKLITNQLGYVFMFEHIKFNFGKTLEI